MARIVFKQGLRIMKASEVTKAMLDAFDENIDTSLDSEQKIIAAAVNAVFDDDSPITAEWLVKNGYVKDENLGAIFRHPTIKRLAVSIDPEDGPLVSYGPALLTTKTIGQLRALEIGLGMHT